MRFGGIYIECNRGLSSVSPRWDLTNNNCNTSADCSAEYVDRLPHSVNAEENRRISNTECRMMKYGAMTECFCSTVHRTTADREHSPFDIHFPRQGEDSGSNSPFSVSSEPKTDLSSAALFCHTSQPEVSSRYSELPQCGRVFRRRQARPTGRIRVAGGRPLDGRGQGWPRYQF